MAALALLLPVSSLAQPAQEDTPPPPQVITEELTVTATRTERRLGDTAASVVVLSAQEISSTAAPTLDDALRQVPGFSLFRRSGSRFANPTSQGVSLRGLGASGASRALVLADGIPLNDPFGGWIYWGRVPRASLSQIEVLRGAASDLYGSAALAGVVQLVRRDTREPVLIVESSYGELATPEGSLFVARSSNGWGVSLAGEAFRTAGYTLVEPAARGAIDIPAASRHASADLTLERWSAGGGRFFLRASGFDESRDNGTPLQVNDTEIRQASAGGDLAAAGGWLTLRGYASDQDFHQTFTAVAADRNSERLTREQDVPAKARGLSGQGSWELGDRQGLIAGIDLREVVGTSDETIFGAAAPTRSIAEGRQRTGGLFVEDLVSVSPRLSLALAGRLDVWRSAGRIGEEREETAFSPRASLLFRATDRWAWTASAYRGFRAPTLNELYRAFRVGDALTLANEALEAERLAGAESGAIFTARDGRVSARGTLFWMEVDRTIANVTLSVAPGLITRQRRNLGRTRSRGVEAEVTARAGERWTLSGGYLLADATVESARQEPGLEGLRLAQVPRHQASLQVRFFDPEIATVAVQARWNGEQFDDDRNELRLAGFAAVDALVSRALGKGVDVFLAGENLTGERAEIGRTPVRTLGPPRTLRLGFRIERRR